jgi:pimeloyl-ACP methyl ester carboxylesterase
MWLSSVVALVGLVAIASPAEASSGVASIRHDKPGGGVISFELPRSPGQAISPNAMNYATSGAPGSPLLLFLPATRAVPADYRQFLDAASAKGFHVLALDYWNEGNSVVRMCRGIPDCYTAVQQNRLDGSHPSVYSAISPADSIVNRLRVALSYLNKFDSTGGWTNYVSGSRIKWNKIVVAGHSQGGGQSAFIAHKYRVRGVLMFSSPVESDNGVPASWMTSPGATPASAMYGFVSANDVYNKNIVESWAALGLGKPVNTTTLAPAKQAHVVQTTLALGTPGQSHVRDITNLTPRSRSGVPVFAPIWNWMLSKVR